MTKPTPAMIADIEARAAASKREIGPDYPQILADVAAENNVCPFALREAFIRHTVTEPN